MAVERLLTKREYAFHMNVSEPTVDKWVRDEKLSPIRTPGGAPRFRAEMQPNA